VADIDESRAGRRVNRWVGGGGSETEEAGAAEAEAEETEDAEVLTRRARRYGGC
jgi:hypothetical protein